MKSRILLFLNDAFVLSFYVSHHVYGPSFVCLLQRVPVIHLFDARFKEQIGELSAAHAAFLQCEMESDSGFVEYVRMKANMEKRLVSNPSSNLLKLYVFSQFWHVYISLLLSFKLSMPLLFKLCQGNFVAASNTYKEALELASAKKNLKILPALYIYFSRLIYVVSNCLPSNYSYLSNFSYFISSYGSYIFKFIISLIINNCLHLFLLKEIIN